MVKIEKMCLTNSAEKLLRNFTIKNFKHVKPQ